MSTTARHARMLDATTPEAPLHLPTLERYWRDPDFAAREDAARAEWQRQVNAMIDEGIRKHRAKLENAHV